MIKLKITVMMVTMILKQGAGGSRKLTFLNASIMFQGFYFYQNTGNNLEFLKIMFQGFYF